MKRLRRLVLSVEGIALGGIVTFSVVGTLNSQRNIYIVLQVICGLVILAGEVAVHRLDTRLDD